MLSLSKHGVGIFNGLLALSIRFSRSDILTITAFVVHSPAV
jgi:hypothetical protein